MVDPRAVSTGVKRLDGSASWEEALAELFKACQIIGKGLRDILPKKLLSNRCS